MKRLALFSGGLDSILALKLIKEQGVDMGASVSSLPFSPLKRVGSLYRAPLTVVDIMKRMLTIVLSPRHGYGKPLNPYIDCHALMVKLAGEMLNDKISLFVDRSIGGFVQG